MQGKAKQANESYVCLVDVRLAHAREHVQFALHEVKQCKAKPSKQIKATCASLPFSLHVLVSMYSLLCMLVR